MTLSRAVEVSLVDSCTLLQTVEQLSKHELLKLKALFESIFVLGIVVEVIICF